ncbi:oxygenase MpaB family protein [Amycolatopsis cihanbeyliensis]|uniref:Uncharacterized protein DUF2236 n=1 Tax=Amycolatopsis cihanbeyliensis TaxID=1128664 RepID=A0A542DS21_AMYCI|nr:oxygenase MpaB family protein [Amycolatopsis cihanbeyliensis]TQJ05902.1 uncharacterized protein DUF2236 [Amycolatopsis cihanbeyliensis]
MVSLLLSKRRTEQRYARLREIESMDVGTHYTRIWYLAMGTEFPWDYSLSGALGFYNSIAPRGIADILVRTGELTGNTRRRMEHHGAISLEIARRGCREPSGKAAVRQLNRIHHNAIKSISTHGHEFTITNEMYLFVLATSMLTQMRWVDRHGWRPLSEQERKAACLHFREQGKNMGMTGIPESYDEFVRLHDDYVDTHVHYSPEAEKLYRATQDVIIGPLVGWLPARLTTIGTRVARAVVPALLTPHLRRAFGVATPSPLLRAAVRLAIKARSAYVRRTPPRQHPIYPDPLPTTDFPQADYEWAQLGPSHSGSATPGCGIRPA